MDKKLISQELFDNGIKGGSIIWLGAEDAEPPSAQLESWLDDGMLDELLRCEDEDADRGAALENFLYNNLVSGKMGYLVEFNYPIPYNFRFDEEGKVISYTTGGMSAGRVFYVDELAQSYPLAIEWAKARYNKELDEAKKKIQSGAA